MATFQVTEIVNLKSNNDTPMTIEKIDGDIAHCRWLNKNGGPEADSFNFAILEKFVSLQERFSKTGE